MDLLVKDESPSQVSDAIKDLLFAEKLQTASKIEDIRPKKKKHLFLTMMSIWTNHKVKYCNIDTSVDLDLSKYK